MASVNPIIELKVSVGFIRRPPSRWVRFWHRVLLGWHWDGMDCIDLPPEALSSLKNRDGRPPDSGDNLGRPA